MATDGGNAGRMPHSMPARSADAGEAPGEAQPDGTIITAVDTWVDGEHFPWAGEAQSANADVRELLGSLRSELSEKGQSGEWPSVGPAIACVDELEQRLAPRVPDAPRGVEGELLSGGFPDVPAGTSSEVGASLPVPAVPVGDETEALRDPFANDVLERLARSNMDYQRTHGHYIVPLAERLLAERARVAGLEAREAALRDALDQALALLEGDGHNDKTLNPLRAALAALPADSEGAE